jgi:hypothetical protein
MRAGHEDTVEPDMIIINDTRPPTFRISEEMTYLSLAAFQRRVWL